jgi:hypothetical protein
LKAVGEIREQIRLQMDLFKTMHNVEMLSRFQQIVLEEIGCADPEIQQNIARRLNDAHALHGAVEFN